MSTRNMVTSHCRSVILDDMFCVATIFAFKEMRVTVCFVDIGGIDNHHYSHFHFIITQITGIATE
jgi:hypothetical protein